MKKKSSLCTKNNTLENELLRQHLEGSRQETKHLHDHLVRCPAEENVDVRTQVLKASMNKGKLELASIERRHQRSLQE